MQAIATVSATDSDEHSQVEYQLMDDADQLFAVDRHT